MRLVTVDKRHSYELVLAEFHPFRKVAELLFNQPCENYFDLAPEKFNALYAEVHKEMSSFWADQ
jgi:hypothetical protein